MEDSYGTVARMARKQVIVQLDDDLVRELDEAATAAGISRSEAIRRAARSYLDDVEDREIAREYEEAYRRIPPGAEWDDEYAAMARRGEQLVPGPDGIAVIAKVDEAG